MSPAPVRKAVTYKLPPELLEKVAARAVSLGCTRTQVVQLALETALSGMVVRSGGPRVAEAVAPVRTASVPVVDRAAAFRAAAARREG